MGFFDKIRAMAGSAANSTLKYGGNKDFLEAVCASSALVAAADGDISDDEISAAVETMKGNKTISGAFTIGEIERTMDDMLKRAKSMSGRASLMRELDDVKRRATGDDGAQQCEDIFLAAADVAASSGGIDAKEQAVLGKIAGRLGVDARKFDLAA